MRSAASGGHLSVVKYLYECKADLSADRNGALRGAVEEEREDVVEWLAVEGGLDLEKCDMHTRVAAKKAIAAYEKKQGERKDRV